MCFDDDNIPSKSDCFVPEKSVFQLLLWFLAAILLMILMVLWFLQEGLLFSLFVSDVVNASCWLLMLSLDLGLRPAVEK